MFSFIYLSIVALVTVGDVILSMWLYSLVMKLPLVLSVPLGQFSKQFMVVRVAVLEPGGGPSLTILQS